MSTDFNSKEAIKVIKARYADFKRNEINQLLNKISRNTNTRQLLNSNGFVKQIIGISHLMDKYNNSEYQSAALDTFEASPVRDRVELITDSSDELNYSDHLVKELLKWFKEEFFKWVNKADCIHCGNKDQDQIVGIGAVRGYTLEHQRGEASVVEKYKCLKCLKVTEFARYNNPAKLLEYRKGRCGEWNNCFILLLKSLGMEVRYLWNLEDHVWCEYYSTGLKRWIHLDSCENAFDNPMLYSKGWGKKMSYVFAVNEHYIIDVTSKYVDYNDGKSDNKIARDRLKENELANVLAFMCLTKFSKIEDDNELLETLADFMNDCYERNKLVGKKIEKETPTTNDDTLMLPRQSGSVDWTTKRGESGE